MVSWSGSMKRAMDRVQTTWAGIIKHLLDRTSPNIIFIWSGKVILGLGFASPNITLPDQINMTLVSVLSNKCILFLIWINTHIILASHNSVLTVQTVLFISTVVLRRIQFRINRRMDGYHYKILGNRTEDDLIKFYEISYKRNIIFINKGTDGFK